MKKHLMAPVFMSILVVFTVIISTNVLAEKPIWMEKVVSGVYMFLCLLAIVLWVVSSKKSESVIESKDERLIAIREKAGSISHFFSLFTIFIMMNVFADMEYTVPAIIAGGAIIINAWGYVFWIMYYRKKI
jgi:Ca2+/Na+ antiporter